MKVTIEFEMPSLPGPIEVGREGAMIAELIRKDAFDWRVAHGLRVTTQNVSLTARGNKKGSASAPLLADS